MITADNIIDEQIRELLASAGPDDRIGGHYLIATCHEALAADGDPNVHLHGSSRAGARRRCAEVINARAASKDGAK